jgi:hypothetical protein
MLSGREDGRAIMRVVLVFMCVCLHVLAERQRVRERVGVCVGWSKTYIYIHTQTRAPRACGLSPAGAASRQARLLAPAPAQSSCPPHPSHRPTRQFRADPKQYQTWDKKIKKQNQQNRTRQHSTRREEQQEAMALVVTSSGSGSKRVRRWRRPGLHNNTCHQYIPKTPHGNTQTEKAMHGTPHRAPHRTTRRASHKVTYNAWSNT